MYDLYSQYVFLNYCVCHQKHLTVLFHPYVWGIITVDSIATSRSTTDRDQYKFKRHSSIVEPPPGLQF